MKKGIFTWYGVEADMETRLRGIKEAGFDAVMLDWTDEHTEHGAKEDYARRARCLGLEIENGHLSFENINDMWLDTLAGEARCESLRRDILSAGENGVHTLVIHVSSGRNPPPITEAGLLRYGSLIETAEGAGVRLAFENLRHEAYLYAVLDRYHTPAAGF